MLIVLVLVLVLDLNSTVVDNDYEDRFAEDEDDFFGQILPRVIFSDFTFFRR